MNLSFTTFTEWDQSWWKKLNVGDFIGGIAPLTEGYVKFYPKPDFSGTAKFKYTVTDGSDVATAGQALKSRILLEKLI
ncbi:Ig-like domain-containing protein [Paenibacillus sp. NPDC056933]|uniref:Ig-like domain-containing protein n=1 Tax=Paenibacillus sp. NPDC056933 TaxID=3345968 RepID=UPI003635E6A7